MEVSERVEHFGLAPFAGITVIYGLGLGDNALSFYYFTTKIR